MWALMGVVKCDARFCQIDDFAVPGDLTVLIQFISHLKKLRINDQNYYYQESQNNVFLIFYFCVSKF